MITLDAALGDAQRKRFAIGHFNVSDLVAVKAVTGAARVLNVPVLVGTSEGERNFLGVHEIVALVRGLRQQLEHPIFLNADHTHSLERAVEAAQAGYDMIGFDASTMPLDKEHRAHQTGCRGRQVYQSADHCRGRVGVHRQRLGDP